MNLLVSATHLTTSSTFKAIDTEIQIDQQWIKGKRHQLQAWSQLFHQWSADVLESPNVPCPYSDAHHTFNLPKLLTSHVAFPTSSTLLPQFQPSSLVFDTKEAVLGSNLTTHSTTSSSSLSSEIGVSLLALRAPLKLPPKRFLKHNKNKNTTKKSELKGNLFSSSFNGVQKLEFLPPVLLFSNYVPNQMYMAKLKVKNKLPQLLHLNIDACKSTFFHFEEFHLYSSSSTFTLAIGMVAEYEIYFRPKDAFHLQAELMFCADQSMYPYSIQCVNESPRLSIRDLYWDPPEFFHSQDLCVSLTNLGGRGDFTIPHWCSFTVHPHQRMAIHLNASNFKGLELRCRNGSTHHIPMTLPSTLPQVHLNTSQCVFLDSQSRSTFHAQNLSPFHFYCDWVVEPPYFDIEPNQGEFLPHSKMTFQCSLRMEKRQENVSLSRFQATATLLSRNHCLSQLHLHFQAPLRQIYWFPEHLDFIGHVHQESSISFFVYSTYATSSVEFELHHLLDVSFLTWTLEGPRSFISHAFHEYKLKCHSAWPMGSMEWELQLHTPYHSLTIPLHMKVVGAGITMMADLHWSMLVYTPTSFSMCLSNPCPFEVHYQVHFPDLPEMRVECKKNQGVLPPHEFCTLEIQLLSLKSGTYSLLIECTSCCEGVSWQDAVACEWHCYDPQLQVSLPSLQCTVLIPTRFTLTLINPVPVTMPFHLCSSEDSIQWQTSKGWVPPLATAWIEGEVCCKEVGELQLWIPCLQTTLTCHVQPFHLNSVPPDFTRPLILFQPTLRSFYLINPYGIEMRCTLDLVNAPECVISLKDSESETQRVSLTWWPYEKKELVCSITPTSLAPRRVSMSH
ncbi:hypothetical protein HMI55_004709 [Coelomomyces lativittatus]|nr:hypothetical protein HMI55_004709 [Coelomomyces lativittatus]